MRNCGATIDRHHRSGDRGNRTKRPLPTILLTAVAFLPGISQAQNFSARQVLPAETSPSPELSTAPVRRQGGQTEKAAREARVNGSHRTQRDADFAETMVELEPVTVTARKQSEDPQKVPISLTVVPDAGATVAPSASNASLARSVPNMTFFDGGGIYGFHIAALVGRHLGGHVCR
jgi:iron complex outermembrane recepter protein